MSDEINNNDLAFDETLEALTEFIEMRTSEINTLKTNTANALTALSDLANRVYGYAHEDFAVKNLDAAYNEIIAENDGLSSVSAVGYIALLRDGDSVDINGTTFINGEAETNQYVFNAENSAYGTELVVVWHFSDSLSLGETELNIIEIKIINRANINVNRAWYDFANKAAFDNFTPSAPKATKSASYSNVATSTATVSALIEDFEDSSATALSGGGRLLSRDINANLKKISYPNLEAYSNSDNDSKFMASHNAEFIVPKLKYINYGVNSVSAPKSSPFAGLRKLTLPDTVEYVGVSSCVGIKNLILNCPDAEFSDGWYRSETGNLDGVGVVAKPLSLTVADNWSTTINLSACAPAAWTTEDFVSIFENKLSDMGDDVREIKIPSAVYDELTDEEFAIAEDKGWTVGC